MKKLKLKNVSFQGMVFFLIVFFGVSYVCYTWIRHENDKFDQALQIARSISATLPKEDLKALEAKPGDIDKPQYQVIKNALKAIIQVNTKARFAYLYTEQNGKIFFLADSEPEDSKDYSPPGQEYTEAKPEDKQPFIDGKELITKSMSDRWGKWTSVLIPIKDTPTGKTIAVFGMDFNAKLWDKKVLSKVLESSIIIELLLLAILFLFRIKAKNKLLDDYIDKQKKAEVALQESEELFRLISDLIIDYIFISKITDSGKLELEKVFGAIEKITGYTAEENKSAGHWRRIVHPEDIEKDNLDFQNLQNNMKVISEIRIFHKNGNIVWLRTYANPIWDEKDNKLVGICGAVQDITERKQMEELILKSKQQYDNLVSNIPVGVYILHTKPEGTFALEYVSPRMAEMLDLSIESLIAHGDAIFKAIHPDDLEGFVRLNQEGIQQKRPFDWKGRTVIKGVVRWLHVTSLPQELESGDTLWHGLIVDITEQMQADAETKLQNEELQKINAEKDKFFSIIAHDLRSPFNGFLGLTQIIAEELHDMTSDEIQKIAVSMRKSAINFYRLLENLLEWARMKQGLIPFNPKVLELGPIIAENIATVLESTKNKRIEIVYDIPEDMTIFADSNMLHTVIRNLFSNAVKFTHKGGKVGLSAKYINKSVEISIRDTGIGMSPEMVKNLFRLDVQTNRKGTEGEPSSGLGLLLCKEFIEKHGGKIWAESDPEGLSGRKGSVFYFTLPSIRNLGEINTISADSTNNQLIPEVSGLKVLIVEDDEDAAKFIAIAIKTISKEILKVRTGVEAVEACRSNPDIDLVLMDIQMPDMDGYEATRQIRKFGTEIVIFAQTAFALTGDREKAIEAGCNEYIAKPIKKVQLLELMQKYF